LKRSAEYSSAVRIDRSTQSLVQAKAGLQWLKILYFLAFFLKKILKNFDKGINIHLSGASYIARR
jgi:hypothetical protein